MSRQLLFAIRGSHSGLQLQPKVLFFYLRDNVKLEKHPADSILTHNAV